MEHPSTDAQDKLRASSLPAEALCEGWEGYERSLPSQPTLIRAFRLGKLRRAGNSAGRSSS